MLEVLKLYLDTPFGEIYLHGKVSEYVSQSILFFVKPKNEDSVSKIIAEITLRQEDYKWVYVFYEGTSKRVYFNSILDYINNLLSKIICQYSVGSHYVVLHGAACVYNGRTIIIIGEKGAGKTTLLLNSLKIGAEYLSDDNIIVNENNVFPLHTAIRVKNTSSIKNIVSKSYNGITYLSNENFDLHEEAAKLPRLILQPLKSSCDDQSFHYGDCSGTGYELLTKNLKNPYSMDTLVLSSKIFKRVLGGSLICKVDNMNLDRLYEFYNSI